MRRADSLWKLACRRDIVRGALQVSAVVGVLLNVINQGRGVMLGVPIDWGRVAMNFAVPFLVSSYSAARNERGRRRWDGSAAADCADGSE